MMTARDMIAKAICHDEQLEIWADEFVEHLLAAECAPEFDSCDAKITYFSAVKDAIKDLVGKAFEHPELKTDSVHLELAALLCPGYAIVPIKATEAMIDELTHIGDGPLISPEEVWAYMLAAATAALPTPPSEGKA